MRHRFAPYSSLYNAAGSGSPARATPQVTTEPVALMTNDSRTLTRYQLRLLAILALINFVNFADRLVVPPLFPLLRQHFGVTDDQLGSLQTWLLVVLALTTLPFGLLA